MTIDVPAETGGEPQIISALYADAGGIPGEALPFHPLIGTDLRGNGVDDQVEDSQPAEKAGKPVPLPTAFYNILAIAAGELHDSPVTQGVARREGSLYLYEEPVMYRYAGIVQEYERRGLA